MNAASHLRDDRDGEDDDLAVDPDVEGIVGEVDVDAAPDAVAALHDAGGDADRAETLLEDREREPRTIVVREDEREV